MRIEVGDRVEFRSLACDHYHPFRDTGTVREVLADGRLWVQWSSGECSDVHSGNARVSCFAPKGNSHV